MDIQISGDGHVAFRAEIGGAGVTDSNNEGIWAEGMDGLRLIAREGTPAPGAQPGADFGPLSTFAFNDRGHIAFQTSIVGEGIDVSNDEGIWSNRSGVLSAFILEGMQAPGTETGTVFGDRGPEINACGNEFTPAAFYRDTTAQTALDNNGNIAFRAILRGDSIDDSNYEGIWSDRSGTLSLLVREGMESPGIAGSQFRSGPPVFCCFGGPFTVPAFEEYLVNNCSCPFYKTGADTDIEDGL